MSRYSIALALAVLLSACGSSAVDPGRAPDPGPTDTFDQLMRGYVRGFLLRNPVVATYLGASGLDPALAEIDGELRDHSARALAAEDRWLEQTLARFTELSADGLTPEQRVDREVAVAQIRFLLRQHRHRRHQERAVDTYVDEPFRGIDWQLQGMSQTGGKTRGSAEEWRRVVQRVAAIPAYLAAAQAQLEAGVRSRNTPDHRMLRRSGIDSARAGARYFASELPARAAALAGPELRERVERELRAKGAEAAAAYDRLADFIERRFFRDPRAADSAAGIKPELGGDRFAFGQAEYDWALASNLRIQRSSAALYEEAWPIVQATRGEMIALARAIAKTRSIALPRDDEAAVRRVFEALGADHPRSEAEMLAWYRRAAVRLVDYGRRTGLFDIPADYQLDIAVTPAPLRASISGAAYYPAPPFKGTGVGRFYVGADTPEKVARVSAASVADLTAHEGFPGHDWHFKVMSSFHREISPVRWLTPGAVEDSSSMWQDSMATEGWGLYAEALVAEPAPGAPSGAYTAEERLYQLRGQLLRDLRVRVDIGIHTGRLRYDEAVDLVSQVMDFLPGPCAGATAPAKRASCHSAERSIYRYSRTPTQAITYRLGRDQIRALRDRAAAALGPRFSAREFHVRFMRQGTISPGYFGDQLIEDLKRRSAD